MGKQRKTHPSLTTQRVAELAALARKIDVEEGQRILAKGRGVFARHEVIRSVIAAIRRSRIEQGLSLAEVGERSGIGKANLSRLENDQTPNPTWDTIAKYAESVGKKLDVAVR